MFGTLFFIKKDTNRPMFTLQWLQGMLRIYINKHTLSLLFNALLHKTDWMTEQLTGFPQNALLEFGITNECCRKFGQMNHLGFMVRFIKVINISNTENATCCIRESNNSDNTEDNNGDSMNPENNKKVNKNRSMAVVTMMTMTKIGMSYIVVVIILVIFIMAILIPLSLESWLILLLQLSSSSINGYYCHHQNAILIYSYKRTREMS